MGVKSGCNIVYLAPPDCDSLECPHALVLFLNITLVIGQVKTLRVNHFLRGAFLYESSVWVSEWVVG